MPANRPQLAGDYPVLDDTPNTATAIEQAFLDGGGVPVSTNMVTDTGLDDKVPSVKAVETAISAAFAGVKVYRATLSQEDVDAPVATVLENTLSAAIVWTRTSAGLYVGTLVGAFTVNKTILIIGTVGTVAAPGMAVFVRSNSDEVAIATKDSSAVASDDKLNMTAVEIRVYP